MTPYNCCTEAARYHIWVACMGAMLFLSVAVFIFLLKRMER